MNTTFSSNQTKYIMNLIRENNEFQQRFIKISGEIRADVTSFINNPGCSCRKRVGAWIQTHSNEVDALFQTFKEETKFEEEIPEVELRPAVEKIKTEGSLTKTETEGKTKAEGTVKHISELANENVDKSRFGMKVAGEVVELDADPESYKSLIKTAQKEMWIYKGLSVMETYKLVNGAETTVWLVFFF